MLSLSVPRSNSSPQQWRRSALFVFVPALVLLVAGVLLLASAVGAFAAPSSPSPTASPLAPEASQVRLLEFRDYDYPRTQLDTATVSWVVVNKQRPIYPQQFEPQNLVAPPSSESLDNSRQIRLTPAPAAAISQLAEAMADETGATLVLHSGFRSFAYQIDLFAAKVEEYGEQVALIRSAKAGFSEHQTGLAVDVSALGYECVIEQCLGETLPGEWIAENAWRFGFIVRYPPGATDITGYTYEPWHLRYLGVQLAAEYQSSGALTLEEFWGLPAAPDYPAEPITESTNS